jgi:D-alanyl-D-alanine carboxypeptidase/D-alanyl-D-alanine-endopeptidase (penicillin-binding protein 4)
MVINGGAMKVRLNRLLIVALVCGSFAQTAGAGLAGRINGIVHQPGQSKVDFSIEVVKAESGERVYSHNAQRALIPASNMKIVVTAAALEYLGPDYKFVTEVGLCGDTLVIIGGGDPLLGDEKTDSKYGRGGGWVFEDIGAALKEQGIASIRDVLVDAGVFDSERVHPNWPREQLNRWYACEVSGVNYNDNCIDMEVKNVGGRAVVSIKPSTDFVKITNRVRAIVRGKSGVGALRTSVPNALTVKGKVKKAEGPFPVAIERPAAFFGYLLAEHLVRSGIKTEGELVEKAVPEDCKVRVLKEYTHSLSDCLARCNKNSLGLAAESLLKMMAANSRPDRKNGSWARGRVIVSRYMGGLGIDGSQYYVDDASGLSRQNKLSAHAVTAVLRRVYKSRNWKLYEDSLAVGGVDGTIKRYFKEAKYKGKVLGKTGYISRVKTFSGICKSRGGDYMFSILANNTNGKTRGAINGIAKAIIDEAEASAMPAAGGQR